MHVNIKRQTTQKIGRSFAVIPAIVDSVKEDRIYLTKIQEAEPLFSKFKKFRGGIN